MPVVNLLLQMGQLYVKSMHNMKTILEYTHNSIFFSFTLCRVDGLATLPLHLLRLWLRMGAQNGSLQLSYHLQDINLLGLGLKMDMGFS